MQVDGMQGMPAAQGILASLAYARTKKCMCGSDLCDLGYRPVYSEKCSGRVWPVGLIRHLVRYLDTASQLSPQDPMLTFQRRMTLRQRDHLELNTVLIPRFISDDRASE
jgi:hypothetical protein